MLGAYTLVNYYRVVMASNTNNPDTKTMMSCSKTSGDMGMSSGLNEVKYYYSNSLTSRKYFDSGWERQTPKLMLNRSCTIRPDRWTDHAVYMISYSATTKNSYYHWGLSNGEQHGKSFMYDKNGPGGPC